MPIPARETLRQPPHRRRIDVQVDARRVASHPTRSVRRAPRARTAGVPGRARLGDLDQVLPTAIVPAFAGELIDTRGPGERAGRPFPIARPPKEPR